jgi:hypothetical protein
VKEFAIYTVARVAMFLATLVVLGGAWLLLVGGGSSLFWPFLMAVVISAVGSYYLLRGPRERFAQKVEERAARMTARLDAARTKEDTDL